MQPTLVTFDPDETPTKPVNDAPTLLRIRRLASLARERLEVQPDEDSVALVVTELQAIEDAVTGALR